jgi:hypothetical protein
MDANGLDHADTGGGGMPRYAVPKSNRLSAMACSGFSMARDDNRERPSNAVAGLGGVSRRRATVGVERKASGPSYLIC